MRAPFAARLAFVVLVVAEIALLVLAGRWLGGWVVFWLVLATAFLGFWAIQRAGVRTWTAMRDAVQAGQPPELSGAGSVFTGGLLLVLPGFLTDLLGVLLVAPPTRSATRRALGGLLLPLPLPRFDHPRRPGPGQSPAEGAASGHGEVIEGEVVDRDTDSVDRDREGPGDGDAPPGRS